MGYKDGKYWREEQDELMRVLLTTKQDSREWLCAYKEILPRLKRMAISILRRYYGAVEEKKAQDLITDAITNLLIKGKYNPDKPKMYSYVGTIFKRYFYDELVADLNKLNNNDDEIDEHIINTNYHQPDFEDFDLPEKEALLQELINIIDNGIKECDEVLKRNNINGNGNTVFGRIREREFLLLSKEYFNNNFIEGTVSAKALADYVQGNIEIPDYVLSKYMRRYFNIGAQPNKMDNKIVIDWCERKNVSYLMDDHVPMDISITNYKKNRKKYTGFEYF